MHKTFPPEFSELVAQYRDTSAGLGGDHPISRRLWLLVITTAPAWFREEINSKAKTLGLLPEAWGYDDSGQRFYSVDDLATRLGMTRDEMSEAIETLKQDNEALGLSTADITRDGSTVHRAQ